MFPLASPTAPDSRQKETDPIRLGQAEPKQLNCSPPSINASLPQWIQLGNTLDSWKEEIATMWRFTRNNGITEGFHNKMEPISRQAYGFRNFENYRLRVKVLCA